VLRAGLHMKTRMDLLVVPYFAILLMLTLMLNSGIQPEQNIFNFIHHKSKYENTLNDIASITHCR